MPIFATSSSADGLEALEDIVMRLSPRRAS
jgi:hypothetical protein